MKKRIIIGLLVAALVLTIAVAANATTGAKQIEATYRNIVIMANGSVVQAQPGMGEPFIVTSEGRTYVPIRMAAEAMGLSVEWVDWLNAVQIKGSTSSAELEALKAENAALKDKIAKLEKGGDLSDLEDDLNSDYDELGDVAIEDISLDGDEDNVDVEIEVDLDDYGDEWQDLSDSDIEDWIEDLVGDIQDELSDDTYVSGKIIDIDSDDTLVKFNKNGDSSLKVAFYDEDYRDGGSGSDVDDVIDDLKGDSYRAGGVKFVISSISYNEDGESVTVKVTSNDSDSRDVDSSDLEDAADEIYGDIESAFDDEDIDVNSGTITFYDDEGRRLERFSY